MRPRRLLWRLYPPYLAIILVSLLLVTWYASRVLHNSYREQIAGALERECLILKGQMVPLVTEGNRAQVDRLCKRYGSETKTRITVIEPNGVVIGDSNKDPGTMDNHSRRPEVVEAVAHGFGRSVRYSATLGVDMMYVAFPMKRGSRSLGVVRTSVPLTQIEKRSATLYSRVFLGAFVVAIAAAVLSLLISKWISRPLVQMKEGAERFSRGDFEYRLPVPKSAEMGSLAESVNQMVERLQELENVRRDFVANVSHEIKTPITSIKGFVETLLDGALEDPSVLKRFLGIISRQADRLNLLVTDLLSLSNIEREEERGEIVLERQEIRVPLAAAVQACEPQAEEKAIRIDLDCPECLQLEINAPLLEQAFLNLIDNAVKYSEPEKVIRVEVLQADGEVLVRVRDQGCGIAEEHLPRLFERFYRVDKARSRKIGGTGLGLAIVKHIAKAHHGRVSVQSKVGEGSIFTVHLPTA